MQRAVLEFLAAMRRWHERVVPWLEVPRDRLPFWLFGIVLLAIVLLGALLRARFLLAGLSPADSWLGQPLLTSADGYYFASGVGAVLTNDWGPSAGVAPIETHALVGIAVFLAKLGLSPEAIFTWLPVVVGPPIALPLAFIGRAFSRSMLGLVAALIAVLAPSYLARTSVAYFDTDMFAVTFALVPALFLVRLFRSDPDAAPVDAVATARRDGLLAALTLSTYVWFYDQALPLTMVLSAVAAFGLLILVLLARAHDDRTPRVHVYPAAPEAARHALLIAIGTAPFFWAIRAAATVVAQLVLARLRVRPRTLAIIAVVATIAAFATSPAMRHLLNKVATYTSTVVPVEIQPGGETLSVRDPAAALHDTSWKWHDTTGIVAEARVLPFTGMANKVIGSSFLAVVGLIGCALFLVWRPSLVPIVPIAAIGLFAFLGGHRFLIYLAPALALGVAYAVARLARVLPHHLRLGATALLGVVASVPPLTFVQRLDVQVSINRDDVEALVAIDQRATVTDTTLSWWDFGYVIKYFAKTRTVTDGSRRGDDASFAAEILLTRSPARANHLAHLVADANAAEPGRGAANLLIEQAQAKNVGPEAFLAAVEAGSWPPLQRSGDVYLFLTKRLLPILPVLEAFRPTPGGSDRDASYLHAYEGVRSEGAILYLEDGLIVDADTVTMRRPSKDKRGGFEEKRLREVHVLGGSGVAMHKVRRQGDPSSPLAGVLLRDLGVFIELDARLLETQWAQLYLFENGDPRYYEPVFLSPTTKVYRFK